MRKITQLLAIALIALHSSIVSAQTVDATTAWFNGETFTSTTSTTYTLGSPITYATGYDWSGTIPVIHTSTAATSVTTSGNVLGFSTNTATDLTEGTAVSINTTKLFPTSLSGVIYAKMSSYHCTRGTGIVFKNTDGNTVFGFGSKDNKTTGSNLRYTLDGFLGSGGYLVGNPTLVEFTSASFLRGQWYDWEMVIDLKNKKLIKLTATKNGGGTASISDISLTNGGSIDKLNIVTANYGAAAGLDNVTIGELLPDKIANLTGVTDIQTSNTTINNTYSLTETADISSLSLTNIVLTGGNIVWSISDWGGLSANDQSKISLTRSTGNHGEATLSISNAISADAVITLQAQLNSGTPLTKQISLKAITVDGLKSSISSEITNSNIAMAAITDSNPFITAAKNDLSSAITSAQSVVDNSATSVSDATTALANIKTAESTFATTMTSYNDFLAYINTVQTAYNAEVRTATFFTTIKATLNTALTNAATARTTISSTTDITKAKTALQTAYTQFTTDLPAYSNLETQIATVTSRITAVTPRMGDDRFLMFPTATVGTLTTAKSTASDALANSTTASQLSSAQTALTTALTTFNSAPRVAPVSPYYKIYTYGVDNGDGGTNKMILYADANDSLKYAAVDASVVVNSNWQIKETSAGVYNLINIASGKYLNGMTLSTTSADFTFPEGTSQSNLIAASTDTYFLYYIVNSSSKALEVDSWNSNISCGKFTNTSAAANRFRFCYQFEPVTSITSLNQTATSVNVYSQNQKLIIEGLKTGEKYSVYNTLGATVASGIATASTVELKLNKGIYLVNAGNNIFKFIK